MTLSEQLQWSVGAKAGCSGLKSIGERRIGNRKYELLRQNSVVGEVCLFSLKEASMSVAWW